MKPMKRPVVIALALAIGSMGTACSESTDGGSGGRGGSGGTGGSTGGRGGSGGTGGTGGSTGGTGGSTGGTGGSTGGTGGSTGGAGGSTGGTGGTGGSTGGTGGSTGGTGGSTGGTGGSPTDGGQMDGMGDSGGTEGGGNTGAFTFTSPDFLMISNNRLCHKKEQTSSGGQVSPGLNWSGLPPETKSLAVSLKDRNGGTHWIMCNIPTTVMGLPRDINRSPKPEGSSNTGNWFGPGAGLPYRTYEYRVWAMKVPMLPGACARGLYPAMLMANAIAYKEILVVGTAAGTCPN